MIARAASLLAIFYALGFVLFAFTLGKPAQAKAPATDAIVVLTGGSGRIEHAHRGASRASGQAACWSPEPTRR